MQTRTLGTHQVGAIGLGLMTFDQTGAQPRQQLLDTITAALDAGVTLFDTADAYGPGDDKGAGAQGENERLIASLLDELGVRDRVVLATKGGHVRTEGGGWDTLSRMLKDIREFRPDRVVIDALSELRLLSDSVLRYRRQLLALKKFFNECHCTVLMLDDRSNVERDSHVESIVHGVIALEYDLTQYGSDQRRLRIRKLRGRSVLDGLHDYAIRTGGLEVFPRLIASQHLTQFERKPLPSGLRELDQLLGGGPHCVTLDVRRRGKLERYFD